MRMYTEPKYDVNNTINDKCTGIIKANEHLTV